MLSLLVAWPKIADRSRYIHLTEGRVIWNKIVCLHPAGFVSRCQRSNVLCRKCSPLNIRLNDTNDRRSFLVKWLIRLPGKQEVHGSIPCEGWVSFFHSVLWSYHHAAISVLRTRESIMSGLSHNKRVKGKGETTDFDLNDLNDLYDPNDLKGKKSLLIFMMYYTWISSLLENSTRYIQK